MANLPSLKPDENWQKLPVYAEYPKFSEIMVQLFPDSLVIFGIHPTLSQVQDSWVLSLLGTGSLWALKHEPKLLHAFASPPLLTSFWIISLILQNRIPACWAPLLSRLVPWVTDGDQKFVKASSNHALICRFANWFAQHGGTSRCCWNKKPQAWLNGFIRGRW